jgi:hypothetical protein
MKSPFFIGIPGLPHQLRQDWRRSLRRNWPPSPWAPPCAAPGWSRRRWRWWSWAMRCLQAKSADQGRKTNQILVDGYDNNYDYNYDYILKITSPNLKVIPKPTMIMYNDRKLWIDDYGYNFRKLLYILVYSNNRKLWIDNYGLYNRKLYDNNYRSWSVWIIIESYTNQIMIMY